MGVQFKIKQFKKFDIGLKAKIHPLELDNHFLELFKKLLYFCGTAIPALIWEKLGILEYLYCKQFNLSLSLSISTNLRTPDLNNSDTTS